MEEAARAEETGNTAADPRYREERDRRRAEAVADLEAEHDAPVTTV